MIKQSLEVLMPAKVAQTLRNFDHWAIHPRDVLVMVRMTCGHIIFMHDEKVCLVGTHIFPNVPCIRTPTMMHKNVMRWFDINEHSFEALVLGVSK